jgi:Flp pilus assembly protein TadG
MARRLGSLCRAWLGGEGGNVAAILAILIVPIAGAMSLATETGVWYLHQRAEQRAADAAVLAASIAAEGGGSASTQAATVATSYGYTDNGGDIRVQAFTSCPTGLGVTISCTPAGCPTGTAVISGSSSCVWVYIKRKVPVYLTRVVGYQGDTTLASGQPARTTSALAAAGVVAGNQTYCFGAKSDFTVNGGSKVDWNGCSVKGGGNLRCNGTDSDTNMPFGDAAGSNGSNGGTNQCGTVAPRAGIPWSDTLASQVSAGITDLGSNCASWKTTTTLSGALSSGYNCYGNSLALSGNVTVSNPNTVLVIQNGGLNLGAFKVSTTGSGSLTLVFTGASEADAMIDFSGGGSLDFAGPLPSTTSSNDWQGLAIAVDPNLAATGGKKGGSIDVTLSGGGTQLSITGGIYDINGNVTVSGNIHRASSSAYDCIGVWANNITANGTASFFTSSADCATVGLNLPKVPIVALLQ